jgi:hypothetical protein
MRVIGSAEYQCDGCGCKAIGYADALPVGWRYLIVRMTGSDDPGDDLKKTFHSRKCSVEWLDSRLKWESGNQ